MFVRAVSRGMAALGVGKLLAQHKEYCLVEYFDSPTVPPTVYKVSQLQEEKLGVYTPVYFPDHIRQTWTTGCVLSEKKGLYTIRLNSGVLVELRAEEFFVRWSKPVRDPSQFLAGWITVQQGYCDARGRFVQSQIEQRAAACGISALLSSAIALEPHQFEVVRRVLQDPVQRYLLADEVGLGKTVEAGVLIRQCILDFRGHCTILVIVPSALKAQWKRELSDRFFLGKYLGKNIIIADINDSGKINDILPKLSMLVIDEAHHLNGYLHSGADSLYEKIATASKDIERVILISATPALHNERSFLQMLHILDPLVYDLKDEVGFRDKVQARQKLAEIVAGLVPENIYYLDYSLDELESLFPSDPILLETTGYLREVLRSFPETTDHTYLDLLLRLRAHISEAYRLNRRILRHRRKNVIGATPIRSGASIVTYRSGLRTSLYESLENWRFQETVTLDESGNTETHKKRARVFWQTLEKGLEYSVSGAGALEYLAKQTDATGNSKNFLSILDFMKRSEHFLARSEALIRAIEPYVKQGVKSVIFCSDKLTADKLAVEIRDKLRVEVNRHSLIEDNWELFLNVRGHSVLVCDRRGEEGLNLQGGRKVVVHYDLPLNPNRIEQRMGRVDRYGSSEAVHSLVLACADDPYEVAWVDYVNHALRVFNRSIASLQYLIEEVVGQARSSLFIDGVDGFVALTKGGVGEEGNIDQEIRAIDQQDDLDALGAPSLDEFQRLANVDGDWRTISLATTECFEDFVQLTRSSSPDIDPDILLSAPFKFVFTHQTVTSYKDLLGFCGDALDPTDPRGSRTIPFSFRRETALAPINRKNGVGLLRYGDSLVNGILQFTQDSDRGRSFATWRFNSNYESASTADMFLKFSFIIETDIMSSSRLIKELGYTDPSALEALRRRGDMALRPSYQTIWLDSELREVTDINLIGLLQFGYREQPDHVGAFDISLTGRHLEKLKGIGASEVAYWSDFCQSARAAAETQLRNSSDFITLLKEAMRVGANSGNARLSQLRARLCHSADPKIAEEFRKEEKLAAAVSLGICEPVVLLDVMGVVFLSNDSGATEIIRKVPD